MNNKSATLGAFFYFYTNCIYAPTNTNCLPAVL